MEEIKSSLNNYYKSINTFKNIYSEIKSVEFIDNSNDTSRNKIIINKIEYTYSVLGRFDSSTNFWEWGWAFETSKNKTYDTRLFLQFSLEIEDVSQKIFKDILINSKIKIDNIINLDIILAYSLFLLKQYKYLFVYKIKESNTINKYIALQKLN
jgi:hypothetical protein